MDKFTRNLIPLLIRSFLPFSPFYTNFLVEVKLFSNLDVTNLISPWFFFSSFFAVFFSKKLLHTLGIEFSNIILSGSYFINMVFFLNMKPRSLFGARVIYFISGFTSTFDMVLRFYIAETKKSVNHEKTDAKLAYLSTLKAVFTCLSSCVGQEIVNKTGHYEIPMHISIFTQLFSFIIAIITAINSTEKVDFVEIEALNAILSMDRLMLTAFLASAVSNCYNIFIKFFAASLFRDKNLYKNKENTQIQDNTITTKEEHTNIKIESKNLDSFLYRVAFNVISIIKRILQYPIVYLAVVCSNIVTFILPKYKEPGTVQKKYLNGNIDALTNITCYYGSYLIVSTAPDEYKEWLFICFLLFSSINLFAMTRSKHRYSLYVMYILTGIFSKSCNQITKLFLKKQAQDNNLIVACFATETIVHVIVNQSCKLVKVNSLTKAAVYSGIGLLVVVFILITKIV